MIGRVSNKVWQGYIFKNASFYFCFRRDSFSLTYLLIFVTEPLKLRKEC